MEEEFELDQAEMNYLEQEVKGNWSTYPGLRKRMFFSVVDPDPHGASLAVLDPDPYWSAYPDPGAWKLT